MIIHVDRIHLSYNYCCTELILLWHNPQWDPAVSIFNNTVINYYSNGIKLVKTRNKAGYHGTFIMFQYSVWCSRWCRWQGPLKWRRSFERSLLMNIIARTSWIRVWSSWFQCPTDDSFHLLRDRLFTFDRTRQRIKEDVNRCATLLKTDRQQIWRTFWRCFCIY